MAEGMPVPGDSDALDEMSERNLTFEIAEMADRISSDPEKASRVAELLVEFFSIREVVEMEKVGRGYGTNDPRLMSLCDQLIALLGKTTFLNFSDGLVLILSVGMLFMSLTLLGPCAVQK